MTLPFARLCIDGAMRDATGGKTYSIVDPWTGATAGQAADASIEDVDAATAASRRAFDDSDWSQDAEQRLRRVTRLREAFQDNRQRLVELSQTECGATLGAVNRVHVGLSLNAWDDLLRIFPELQWKKTYKPRQVGGAVHERMALYEPIGVVGAITPWNVPLYIGVGKVVAALLAGCTVVLKPAPQTPGLGSIFGELAIDAGLPPGVLNVVTSSDAAMAGERLVTDPRVDLISFTGSTAVGRRIMEMGGPTLKRVFLELGGKSAKIILDDVPDFATEIAHSAVLFHAGQGCGVFSRLLVPRSRYQEAIEILRATYAAYDSKWGERDNPLHMTGPVASKRQLERVMNYVAIGMQEGARLLAGGKLAPHKGPGFFIEPTCFVDVRPDMRIAQEEIFGPVIAVIPYEDVEDAIRIANNSQYGLSGMVSTGDVNRAMNIVRRIRTGTIGINDGMCIAGDVPFGGYKASGIGREWGLEGIEEFLETKLVAIRT